MKGGDDLKMFNGRVITEAREAKGLSRPQLAAMVGRGERWLKSIEHSERTETYSAVKLTCDTLGINVDDLFTEGR